VSEATLATDTKKTANKTAHRKNRSKLSRSVSDTEMTFCFVPNMITSCERAGFETGH